MDLGAVIQGQPDRSEARIQVASSEGRRSPPGGKDSYARPGQGKGSKGGAIKIERKQQQLLGGREFAFRKVSTTEAGYKAEKREELHQVHRWSST